MVYCIGVFAAIHSEWRSLLLNSNAVNSVIAFVVKFEAEAMQSVAFTLPILLGVTHPPSTILPFQVAIPAIDVVIKMLDGALQMGALDVTSSLFEALRLYLPLYSHEGAFQCLVKCVVSNSAEVRLGAMDVIAVAASQNEANYRYLANNCRLFQIIGDFLNSNVALEDLPATNKILHFLILIADKRVLIRDLFNAGLVKPVLRLLDRNGIRRNDIILYLYLLSNGSVTDVEQLAALNVIGELGRCLNYFKVYDDVLQKVWTYGRASYDFTLIHQILGIPTLHILS
jgi:hypothetical protein